jgi:DNA-binding response OmpR family regulator
LEVLVAERILVVDDEFRIVDFVRRGLVYEGYLVDVAYDGITGLAQARQRPPDLVVLDIMMPGMDGLEVCRRLRATEGGDVPILMLTAKDSVPDRVAGLDAGADDYLVKPFAFDELLARIRALLRRRGPQSEAQILRFADLLVNLTTREVRRGDRLVELTAKEFDLLELFMRHPRQVLTRDTIYEQVWGYDFGGESNIIEVYIRYLRSKLEADGEPRMLQTVRGVGYVLRER